MARTGKTRLLVLPDRVSLCLPIGRCGESDFPHTPGYFIYHKTNKIYPHKKLDERIIVFNAMKDDKMASIKDQRSEQKNIFF